jgi:hypothetical protein
MSPPLPAHGYRLGAEATIGLGAKKAQKLLWILLKNVRNVFS